MFKSYTPTHILLKLAHVNWHHVSVIMVNQQDKNYIMGKVRDKEHIRDFCCGHVIADVLDTTCFVQKC